MQLTGFTKSGQANCATFVLFTEICVYDDESKVHRYLYVYIDNTCLNFSSIVINHEGVASLYSKKEKNSQENLPET